MTRRPAFGLGGKLSLYAALLIVATTATLATLIGLNQFRLLRAQHESLGLGLARATAEQAEIGTFSGDVTELQAVLHSAGSFPGVVAVGVYDAGGHLLARHAEVADEDPPLERLLSRAADGPATLDPPLSLPALREHAPLHFAAPVLIRSGPAVPGARGGPARPAPIGWVVVALSTEGLSERATMYLQYAVATLLGVGALGVGGMAWLAHRALRPLRAVTRAAREVAAGDLNQRVVVDSRDEAGLLAESFNQMTERVREARDTLEQRVAERTRSLEQATAEAWRRARHDALTGLPNRVLLRDRLDDAIADAHARRQTVAALFVDVDHFKTVNDSLGHECGDDVIRAIAGRLDALARPHGFAARLGGDEFVVVRSRLPAGHAQAAAGELAQQLIEAVSQAIRLPMQEVRLGASIGIALFPDDARDATGLLRAADAAMYAAKRDGRMGWRCFSPEMDAHLRDRLRVETELRRGFAAGELELWYQPQFCIADGRLVGAEALLRWRHPEQGLVMPSVFIPVAEESGLIREIGAWVLQQAVREARDWNAIAGRPLRVAVNISAQQLNRDELPGIVDDAIAASGLPFELLELELTESGIVADTAHGLDLLARLRATGVQLAIDDFGTGQSSLAQLTQLPVQTLKIDRAFVVGLPDAPRELAVARAICALARELGLRVLAEGVETPEQLAALRRMGCDAAQGWYFGWPLPADEFRARWVQPLAAEAAATGSRSADAGRAGEPATAAS